MERNITKCIQEFEKFYALLMQNAPEDYIPWFFPCKPNRKDPDPSAILKIDKTSKGSWHHESARLSKEQCTEHIKQGYNIGISARKDDYLIIGDIDDKKYFEQLPKNTLTVISRKRNGWHFFGWNKDDTAKINLPTDLGEMRSDNQYVLACGSFVSTESKEEDAGYYTIKDAVLPRLMGFDDLPQLFKDKQIENIENEAKIKQNEEFKQEKRAPGKYDDLFNLKVKDIVGLIPASKRISHPLHASETAANFSLSKDGALGHCWRHMVSLNAVQYLCVEAGYANCEDAGTPHKGRGLSKIKGDKKALEVAYNLAVEKGLIKEFKKEVYNFEDDEVISKNIDLINVTTAAFFTDDKHPKFIPKVMGDFIKGLYKFKTLKGNDKQIYYYIDGYYKINGIALIKSVATKILKETFKEYYVLETIAYIRNTSYIEPSEINHNWINFKNGLFNPMTNEFKEHTPDIFCLKQLTINYDVNATCPLFEKELKLKCNIDWKYELTQEMFGYCFLSDNRFEKAFLLYGKPRTFKSTVLFALEQLLGEDNIQAMSLQYLSEDKHGATFLYGCPANICADLSESELKNTAMFLKITGQDMITCGKKFEQEITFRPTTKLIFSCNVIPSPKNKNDAFYRRWCLMGYNIQTPEDEVDFLMRDKIKIELSGIFNWAMIGLYRLIKNNKTSYPLSTNDTKDLYERNADSIQSFIYNEIDCEDDNGVIKKRVAYKIYKDYCKENDLNIDNHILFGRRFKAITGCGEQKVGRIPGYAGVSLKNEQNKQLGQYDEGVEVESIS